MTTAATAPELINTENTGYGWTAVFDSYDGAPDAVGKYAMVGHGETEIDAIEDLKFKVEEMSTPDTGVPITVRESMSGNPQTAHMATFRREVQGGVHARSGYGPTPAEAVLNLIADLATDNAVDGKTRVIWGDGTESVVDAQGVLRESDDNALKQYFAEVHRAVTAPLKINDPVIKTMLDIYVDGAASYANCVGSAIANIKELRQEVSR